MSRSGHVAAELASRRNSTQGHPLPPTMKPGYGWDLVKPAHHKGDK